MSVSLNNFDPKLVTAALQKKGKPAVTTAAKTPMNEAMSKTGSIFNLVNSKNETNKTNSKGDLTNLNTLRTIEEFNNKKTTPKKTTTTSDDNSGNMSASEGKAKAAAMEKQADSLKSQTKGVESDFKTANSFSSESQKLDKQIKADQKTFSARVKQDEYQLKKDNQQLSKLIQEQQETQKQVDDAQRELDSLMATSSFSMNRGGSVGSSGNDAKIQELQQFIGSKVSGMQQNGRTIYSLQRSQTRTISNLNKSNVKFVKAQQVNTKAMEQKESTAEKIINVATKVEQISQLVTAGGQTLKMLGAAMIAAGSTPFTAWMVPVGTVMAKVGTVAEMVGNYGSTAANLTKTGAYAAEGNIQGAIQSAASAAMTGAAAINQTKGLKGEFGKINDQAKDVNITREANVEAKKQVDEAKTKAMRDLAKDKLVTAGADESVIDKMSPKELEKALKYAKKEQPDIFGFDSNGKPKSLDDAINAKAFGTDKNNNPITASQARKATSATIQNDMRAAKSGDAKYVASRNNAHSQANDVRENIAKTQRGSTSSSVENGEFVFTKQRSAFERASNGGFTNTVNSSLKKSTTSFDFKKLSGLGSMAAGLNQNSNQTNSLNNDYSTKTPKKKSAVAQHNEWVRTQKAKRKKTA